MKNLFFLLVFLFAAPIVASSQYIFSADVDEANPCCIKINIRTWVKDPDGTKQAAWTINVDGVTYNANSPEYNGQYILHCVDFNSTYVVTLTSTLWGTSSSVQTVEITDCQTDCKVCNISDILLWPHIMDTCTNTISLAVTFPNIGGVQGPSPLCTNASYTWSYGDGHTNTTTDPYSFDIHTYNSPGTYEVCVRYSIINPSGDTCSITKCHDIVVPGCPKDKCCNFTMSTPTYQTAPLPLDPCLVRLSVSGISGITGCGITTSWDIDGDGMTDGTGSTLFTTFNGPGPHTVCVTRSSTNSPDCLPITKCITFNLPNCPQGVVNNNGLGGSRNSKNNTMTNEEWETAIEGAATESILELFPNPATNELNIKLPNDATSTIESIQVINVNGQVVKTESVISTSLLSIDISTLASGVYMVRTISKDGMTQTTKQFVKNK